ncbi:MAG: hypothetical protein ABMA15_01625 [Vicinamibacterales bacterium]
MTKCVYCTCTANIEPGKGYCDQCGHDAVAHVASSASAGSAVGLKLLIVAGAILAAYFFLNSKPDVVSGLPGSAGLQAPPPSDAPSNAAPTTAPSPGTVYTLPPPTVQPNGQVTPAAPPLGDWRSNPGTAAPDSAAPNPSR